MTDDELNILLDAVKNLCADVKAVRQYLPLEVWRKFHGDVRKVCKFVELKLNNGA